MKVALFSLILLSSCAGYRQPESFQEKMDRFRPRTVNPNPVPEFSKTAPIKSFKANRRRPASAGQEQKLPSTKRLYFMALYNQYKTLGSYLTHSKPAELKHCPSFHTNFVTMNESMTSIGPKKMNFEKRLSKIGQPSKEKVTHFPELSLPLATGEKAPKLYEVMSPQANYSVLFENALTLHLTKTYSELQELCDSGSSENYYTYENLTRHIQRTGEDFTSSPESFKAYMKTTLFSNMALVKSLEKDTQRGRFPASTPKEQSLFLNQLQADWSDDYFSKVGRP